MEEAHTPGKTRRPARSAEPSRRRSRATRTRTPLVRRQSVRTTDRKPVALAHNQREYGHARSARRRATTSLAGPRASVRKHTPNGSGRRQFLFPDEPPTWSGQRKDGISIDPGAFVRERDARGFLDLPTRRESSGALCRAAMCPRRNGCSLAPARAAAVHGPPLPGIASAGRPSAPW